LPTYDRVHCPVPFDRGESAMPFQSSVSQG
jgi:hypothetical protein